MVCLWGWFIQRAHQEHKEISHDREAVKESYNTFSYRITSGFILTKPEFWNSWKTNQDSFGEFYLFLNEIIVQYEITEIFCLLNLDKVCFMMS